MIVSKRFIGKANVIDKAKRQNPNLTSNDFEFTTRVISTKLTEKSNRSRQLVIKNNAIFTYSYEYLK